MLKRQLNNAKDLLVFVNKVVKPSWPLVAEALRVYIFALPYFEHLPLNQKKRIQDDIYDLLYCFECGSIWEDGYSVTFFPPDYKGCYPHEEPEFLLYIKALNLYDGHLSLFGDSYDDR